MTENFTTGKEDTQQKWNTQVCENENSIKTADLNQPSVTIANISLKQLHACRRWTYDTEKKQKPKPHQQWLRQVNVSEFKQFDNATSYTNE